MLAPFGSRTPDATDVFVHAAVRAYATGADVPPPPERAPWVARATAEGVLAPVVAALRSAGHPVPTEIAHLRPQVVARQLRTAQDLLELGTALDGASVPWVVVKGPVLSSVVFARRNVRDFADLDVLVGPRDVERAVHALRTRGAEVLPVDWPHVTRARTAEVGLRLRHGTVLDLHWHLVNLGDRRRGYSFGTEALLRRRVLRTVDGADVPTLDERDLVLHVLLHACLSGCHSLRWLLDVQQCLRWLTCTPAELGARAAELGVQAPARAVLDSVATHLDPAAGAWAATVGPTTAWTRVLGALGRRRPPSTPSVSARTSKAWFASTRPTTAGSLAAVATRAVLTLRYTRRGWPTPDPTPFDAEDVGYQRWLRVARREAEPPES